MRKPAVVLLQNGLTGLSSSRPVPDCSPPRVGRTGQIERPAQVGIGGSLSTAPLLSLTRNPSQYQQPSRARAESTSPGLGGVADVPMGIGESA